MAATAFLGEQSRDQLARLVCAPHATESFPVPSALESAPLGTLPLGTPADVEVATTRARAAQRSWAAMPAYFRLAPMRRLPKLLLAYQNLVADVLRADSGDPLDQALARADAIARECRTVTRSATSALAPVKHRVGLKVASVTVLDPLGVVGVVPNPEAGFDPVPAVAALLAGNALVLVPEGRGSFGGLLLAQLLTAARLPSDLVQVVPGTPGLADALVPLVDHLLLAGSGGRSLQLQRLAGAAEVGVSLGSPSGVAQFASPRSVVPR